MQKSPVEPVRWRRTVPSRVVRARTRKASLAEVREEAARTRKRRIISSCGI